MKRSELLAKLGIDQLNAMQEEAYEAIVRGRSDVVVLSPTGSGKTLAYLLPLTEMIDATSDDVQALVVVPGRELALQSATVLKNMGAGVRAQSCYGGRTAMDEHRTMRQVRPQVVFGTPGRLNDHIKKGNIDALGVGFLVIDEFDKCLEMGFHDEMARLIGALPRLKRRFLLSATESEQIPRFVDMGRTVRIDYRVAEEQVSERVEVYRVDSSEKDKLPALKRLLCQLGEAQTIVFLNYRDSVERVAAYLRGEGFGVSAFHGGMEQRQREDALYKFSNGSANVFVATDLASRGLDIPQIDHIVHYHLPLNEEALVHRVGRTARWDALGKTYFLLGPEEHIPAFVDCSVASFALAAAAQPVPTPRMATLYIGKGKKDKISKGDIVGFLCKTGGLKADELGRIDVSDRYAYVAVKRQKMREVLAKVSGEKIKGIRTIVEPVR